MGVWPRVPFSTSTEVANTLVGLPFSDFWKSILARRKKGMLSHRRKSCDSNKINLVQAERETK